MQRIVQMRVLWVIVPVAIPIAIFLGVIWTAADARQKANEQSRAALDLIDSLHEGHALNVSMLVDGLSMLQEHDDGRGFEILEMLLRHEMRQLETVSGPPDEKVSEALRKGEAYFESLKE